MSRPIDYEKMREDMETILKRIMIVDAELNSIQQIVSVYIMRIDELIEEKEGYNVQ